MSHGVAEVRVADRFVFLITRFQKAGIKETTWK